MHTRWKHSVEEEHCICKSHRCMWLERPPTGELLAVYLPPQLCVCFPYRLPIVLLTIKWRTIIKLWRLIVHRLWYILQAATHAFEMTAIQIIALSFMDESHAHQLSDLDMFHSVAMQSHHLPVKRTFSLATRTTYRSSAWVFHNLWYASRIQPTCNLIVFFSSLLQLWLPKFTWFLVLGIFFCIYRMLVAGGTKFPFYCYSSLQISFSTQFPMNSAEWW